MFQILEYLGSIRFLLKIFLTNLETSGLPESLSYLEIQPTLDREFLAAQIPLYKQPLS